MFTWICPQCGREVPPAFSECPDCAAGRQAPPAPEPAPPPPAPRSPRARRGPPTWLLSILFALAFIALGVTVYWGVNHLRQGKAPPPRSTLESPPAAGTPGKPHPLQAYIEVTGVRFLQGDGQRTEARFLVVNHSPEDIIDLGGTVTIAGRTQQNTEEPVGTFAFKTSSLGPWQSREFTARVDTRLRVYELPDWQNLVAHVVITSP